MSGLKPPAAGVDFLAVEETSVRPANEYGVRRNDTRGNWHVVRSVTIAALAGFIAFLLAGNLAILGAMWWARSTTDNPVAPAVREVSNFEAVDERVWRGAAPSKAGYRSLAAHGVTTVVDLRAEDDLHVDNAMLSELGIRRVHIPIRDGQTPSAEEMNRFLSAATASPGNVFVHCGAGVGRTGTMAAAYLVATGQADAREALRRNLSIGPPSLEQVAFVASMDGDGARRPNTAVTALSRTLDAPRRIWSVLNS